MLIEAAINPKATKRRLTELRDAKADADKAREDAEVAEAKVADREKAAEAAEGTPLPMSPRLAGSGLPVLPNIFVGYFQCK